MALEFYEIIDRKKVNPLYSIPNGQLSFFETIFSTLKEKTSLSIDLYGSTILYRNHLSILSKELANEIEMVADNEVLVSLKKFIDNAIENNLELVIEGE